MTDEQKPDEAKQEHQTSSSPISEPLIEPLAISKQASADTNTAQSNGYEQPAEVATLNLIDRELKPFEQQTVAIAREGLAVSRKTYWIAFFAFLAAVAAAVFVGSQVKIMSYQTQIMGSQTESAAAGAAIGEFNTRRQLDIAQKQANSAEKSVAVIQRQMRQDQRAWMKVMPTLVDGKNFGVHWKIGEPVLALEDVSNIGKTAAQQVKIEVVAEKLGMDDVPSLSFRKGHIAVTTVGDVYPDEPPMQIQVVWAQTYDDGVAVKQPLKLQDYNDLVDGKIYFVFYGRVKYVDIFGVKHLTRFCEMNTPARVPVRMNAHKCSDYNGVDNN